MGQDSFVQVTWLIRKWDQKWRIHMCTMIQARVYRDPIVWTSNLEAMRVPQSTFICVTWLIRVCDATNSNLNCDSFYVYRDSFTLVVCLKHENAITVRLSTYLRAPSYVWHDSFACVTRLIQTWTVTHLHAYLRLIHMYSVTQITRVPSPPDLDKSAITSRSCAYHKAFSHVWHNLFACATRRNQIWTVTHFHVYRDSFTCVLWLTHKSAITVRLSTYRRAPSYVWHNSFTCVTWWIQIWTVTRLHVYHDPFTCVLWLTHKNAVTLRPCAYRKALSSDNFAMEEVEEAEEAEEVEAAFGRHESTAYCSSLSAWTEGGHPTRVWCKEQ